MEIRDEITRVCNVCGKDKPITSYSINGRAGYRRKSCKLCYATRFERMEILIDKEALIEKMCKACKMVKSIKSFHRNNLFKDGYDSRCKLCKQKGITCTKKGNTKDFQRAIKDADNGLRLSSVRREDWLEAYQLLSQMGYDLNKNISEQFCEKYNLKYKEKRDAKGLYKTPKDLGLI
jgi:hypothetical protein